MAPITPRCRTPVPASSTGLGNASWKTFFLGVADGFTHSSFVISHRLILTWVPWSAPDHPAPAELSPRVAGAHDANHRRLRAGTSGVREQLWWRLVVIGVQGLCPQRKLRPARPLLPTKGGTKGEGQRLRPGAGTLDQPGGDVPTDLDLPRLASPTQMPWNPNSFGGIVKARAAAKS
jgi:hypothetical protein